MTSVEIKDRRNQQRVTLTAPLSLAAPDGAERATLRNLSLSGLSCLTAGPIPEMTRLRVRLDLADVAEGNESAVRIELEAAVVRCRPVRLRSGPRRFEVALYFAGLSSAARHRLTELVASRLTN